MTEQAPILTLLRTDYRTLPRVLQKCWNRAAEDHRTIYDAVQALTAKTAEQRAAIQKVVISTGVPALPEGPQEELEPLAKSLINEDGFGDFQTNGPKAVVYLRQHFFAASNTVFYLSTILSDLLRQEDIPEDTGLVVTNSEGRWEIVEPEHVPGRS